MLFQSYTCYDNQRHPPYHQCGNYVAFFTTQENYVGEDSEFTDYENSNSHFDNLSEYEIIDEVVKFPFDHRAHRPFTVVVQVTLTEIQAHLPKV